MTERPIPAWHIVTEHGDGVTYSRWVRDDGCEDPAAFVGAVHGPAAEQWYREHHQPRPIAPVAPAPVRRPRPGRRAVDLLMVAVALLLVAQIVRIGVFVWVNLR